MGTETTNTETTEFSDGSSMVTTTTTETEFLDANGEPEDFSAEVAALEEPAVIGEVTDAAVQIVEIEAGRDIALAEINADARVAEAEAYAGAVSEEREENEWQRNIETRLDRLDRLADLLEDQLTSSTPPQLEASEPNPQVPPNPDESAAPMQANPVAEGESQPEQPKRRKKSRWI